MLGAFLHKHHQHHLRDNHSEEHCEGIDRCVSHRGVLAHNDVVGIVQRHRVSHRAAQHTARRAKIDLRESHSQQSDHNNGHNRNQKS